MKKLAFAIGLSACAASPVFAATVGYMGTARSGTAANPLAGLSVAAGGTASLYYVDPSSGTASNKKAAAIQLIKTSDWSFDFSDPAHVSFTGNIVYGDYKTQSNTTSPVVIDGRQSYYGVTQSFSGVGVFDQATNTFTYNFLSANVDTGGGSVETHTATPTCANGTTFFGTGVCSSFAYGQQVLNWEGLNLSFVFSPDRSAFSGSLVGINHTGSGAYESTTTSNWQVSGSAAAPAVPVPAAAWLFGSGLLGLAGAARRKLA